jgi:maltooligosyltrehalose trehalohydrolase
MSYPVARRFPIGAEVRPEGTHFRVWAPAPREVQLVVEGDRGPTDFRLDREADGYYSVLVPGLGAGARYQYRLDGELCPDPASRFQPDGPEAASQVVDFSQYPWIAPLSSGIDLTGQVVYEMHVGTFTPEGTWGAAAEHLSELARIGITTIEVMPVSEFPGRFGWGYDGVFPYAPTRLYGSPDDFRAFVDRAHQLGLAVILDVVYNHFGPDGCVFRRFAPQYFAEHYANEWGDGLNFDGPCSAPVREYFSSNAAYWISEFRLDGLRLDATQSIHDLNSPEHVIALIGRQARAAAAGRRIMLVAENETQQTNLVRPLNEGGYGLDALWNDDFHHSAVVALTAHREAYYTDHWGAPQEFISAAKYGYLFQGQRYAWQKQGRGSSTRGLQPPVFVNFIENHDQVANSGDGSRLHTRSAPGKYRAMTALFMLLPGTPMLFQGQEFGATTPFLYFADHKADLAVAVQRGRAEFVGQFPSLGSAQMQATLPAPHDPATFERCKLNRGESRPAQVRLFSDLIALRRTEAAFRQQRAGAVDGAVLGPDVFVLRYATERPADERLLVINFGLDVVAPAFPEPLLAPPAAGMRWAIAWSSESPEYGGLGSPDVVDANGWQIPGHSATVLKAVDTEHTDGGHRTDGN